MCLILTVIAALVTTFLWKKVYKDEKLKLFNLALMYWGASIMWLVDSLFSAAYGEGFFDISPADTILGIIVILCGLVMWGILILPAALRGEIVVSKKDDKPESVVVADSKVEYKKIENTTGSVQAPERKKNE
ncbi:MAG: hypothetical protein K6F99_02380 [Lachnospiraceae bacterium]|nr:hypothetical protein [Lachnospiraceae bacterium]